MFHEIHCLQTHQSTRFSQINQSQLIQTFCFNYNQILPRTFFVFLHRIKISKKKKNSKINFSVPHHFHVLIEAQNEAVAGAACMPETKATKSRHVFESKEKRGQRYKHNKPGKI